MSETRLVNLLEEDFSIWHCEFCTVPGRDSYDLAFFGLAPLAEDIEREPADLDSPRADLLVLLILCRDESLIIMEFD